MSRRNPCIYLMTLVILVLVASCATSSDPTASSTPQIPTNTSTISPLPELTLSVNTTPISCADAAIYYQDNEAKLAYQAYQVLLATDPLMSCAIEGQATLTNILATETLIPTSTPTPTPNAATVVPQLIQIGDYAGAWEKAKTGVNDDPSITDSIKKNPYLIFIKIKNWIAEFIAPFVTPVIVLVVLILMILFLVRRYRTIQLDLQDFTSGTYYINETVKGSLGKSITARIELILKQKFDNPQNSTKGLVNAPINPPDLPASVPASISGFWTFISKLVPPRVIVVEGLLENSTEKQLGLSVKMIDGRNQEFLGHTVFWAKDFNIECTKTISGSDDVITEKTSSKSVSVETKDVVKTTNVNGKKETITPGDDVSLVLTDEFFVLADLAAAWIFWKYCEIQKRALRKIFGTDNFESYQWDYLSKKAGYEEEFLNKAVAFDHMNTFALLNLGHYYYEKSRIHTGKDWEANKKTYQQKSNKYLQEVLSIDNQDDLTSINANYNLGCLFHEPDFIADDHDKTKTWEEYFKDAYDYIKVTKAKVSPNLALSLRLPHLYCKILEGSISAADELRRIGKTPSLSAEVLYNLACTYGKFMTLSGDELFNKNKALWKKEEESSESITMLSEKEKTEKTAKEAADLVAKEDKIAWEYFRLALLSLPELMDEYRCGKEDDWLKSLLNNHQKELKELLAQDYKK